MPLSAYLVFAVIALFTGAIVFWVALVFRRHRPERGRRGAATRGRSAKPVLTTVAVTTNSGSVPLALVEPLRTARVRGEVVCAAGTTLRLGHVYALAREKG